MNLRTHIIIYWEFLFRSFTNVFEKNLENEFFFFTLVGFFFSIFMISKICWMLPQKIAKLFGITIEKNSEKKHYSTTTTCGFFQQKFAIIYQI